MGGQSLADLRTGKAEHLQRGRGVVRRSHHAVPVVERIFGPTNCGRGAGDQLLRHIERFLLNEAIEARPPSLLYQTQVFARRNKALVTSLAAIFIVSFCTLLATLVLIFNQLASYPVFVVDAFFPFP